MSKSPIAAWWRAMVLQTLMFSRSEAEFFPSEGCCFYWAEKEKPDFIVFGTCE